MHLLRASVLAASAFIAPAQALYWPESTINSDLLALNGYGKLTLAVIDGSLHNLLATRNVNTKSCNIFNVAVRREYSILSGAEKKQYTNAVKCLMGRPSKIPAGLAPGAKSRYDDFVALHVNQTLFIHNTGNFLSWHRYYTWAFERALQDECGFQGTIPYWNWGKSAVNPLESPYMDGSEYSQGGNGEWAPHACTRPGGNINAPCLFPVVEGRGGGCVEKGPYRGIEANLSAVDTWFNFPNEPVGPKLSYQPRCIKRDISPEYSALRAGDSKLVSLINDNDNIETFQNAFQSGTGLHSVGHFIFGGNPGGDIYTSPNDPLFWLHHSMVDRTWWMWQNQKPTERTFVIAGTRIIMDPTAPKTTLEDLIELDYITPSGMPIAGDPLYNHMSTVAGPYCYVYL